MNTCYNSLFPPRSPWWGKCLVCLTKLPCPPNLRALSLTSRDPLDIIFTQSFWGTLFENRFLSILFLFIDWFWAEWPLYAEIWSHLSRNNADHGFSKITWEFWSVQILCLVSQKLSFLWVRNGIGRSWYFVEDFVRKIMMTAQHPVNEIIPPYEFFKF